VLVDHPTAADAERLHHALVNEREGHRSTRRALAALTERLEALEQRPPAAGPDLATITSGLAGIRADLRAELAAVRAEVADLAEIVHQFARQ
jgi:predicted  nucleic acid-binding Zn-ribbon protein